MKYTVKDSNGRRVTSIRVGKGKTFLADITGVFTLNQAQVVELCGAGYQVTALTRKAFTMPCVVTGKGAKPVRRTLGTAQIVELFRKGYQVDPIRAPAASKPRSKESTVAEAAVARAVATRTELSAPGAARSASGSAPKVRRRHGGSDEDG